MTGSGRTGWRARVLHAGLVALTAPLYGCLFFISTGPTPISQANIVVVVRTVDTRRPVADARVRIQVGDSNEDVGGGRTDRDGHFRLTVNGNLQDLRVLVDAPAGFGAPTSNDGSTEVRGQVGTGEVLVLLPPLGPV